MMSLRKLAFGTICACLMAACFGHVNYPSAPARPVVLDEDFSSWQADEIREAAAEWNDALGPNYRFDVRPVRAFVTDDAVQEAHARGITLVVNLNTYGLGASAYTDHYGSIFIIPASSRPAELRGIVMHELGHVLGVGHIESRASLMYPEGAHNACVDEQTIQALRAKRDGWPGLRATCGLLP